MKKILFTHSYFLKLDPKQWSIGKPYAPLGTLHAIAFMRKQGYTVSFFDTMFEKDPDSVIPYIDQETPEVFLIYDDGFNYLTKMCLQNMREAAFKMIRYAKDKGCTVIVSSSDSTDRFELYHNAGADYIIIGEPEQTLLELMRSLSGTHADLLTIKGIVFKQNEKFVRTGVREVMKDLDALPFPAWDMIDMKPYKKMWLKHAGYFSMNMSTTRGCPFKCNWCAKPIYGNRYNSRSPKNVVSELLFMKEQFHFDHIWFCDDIFGLKPGWVKEFADLIEENGLAFAFKIQGRVDLLLQENNIKDLKRAGCENIWVGAESGSQRILDAMDKGTTVDQIYKATQTIKSCGIKPSFFIQFGYLSETKEDIKKTIDMINELLPYEIGISVSYPLPGTKFYEKVKSELVSKTNWNDSDEMALMFRNNYQPAFYKHLHKYVHESYHLHLALDTLKQAIHHPKSFNFRWAKKVFSTIYYLPLFIFNSWKLHHLEAATHA